MEPLPDPIELTVPINQVEPWEKNPRGITKADYERLRRQIRRLHVYKRLLCFEEGGRYKTLGGNMRIRIIKEEGYPEVNITQVFPRTEAEKLEYALSDNDRAGFYEEDKLSELVEEFKDDIIMEDYRVDLGKALDLPEILGGGRGPDFKEYDKKAADGMSLCRCPTCWHEHARFDK